MFATNYNSPLGKIILLSDGEFLTGLYFDGQKNFSGTEKTLPLFEETKTWLEIYFSGKAPNFTPPLKFSVTNFRNSVYQVLMKIPYGETKTYGEIAKTLGSSPRAIGSAVAQNPILIVVPCHRIIGANGNLTGYAGGLDRKAKLLQLENSAAI